jgi:hypothetical protein
MADLPSSSIRDSILAVLRTVKDAGLRSVTRTALVKFVYLLDCLHAEEHKGATASASRWYFDKFGPFATDLIAGIDSMAHVGMIQTGDGSRGDKEFTLYWLGEFPRGPALTEIGLSAGKAGRLEQWVRKFSGDLPKLLDFVYLHTEPMRDAAPGRALSFDSLAIPGPNAAHVPVHVVDHERLFRLLALSNQMGKTYRASVEAAEKQPPNAAIYDPVYANAMAAFEDEEKAEAVQFHANLYP